MLSQPHLIKLSQSTPELPPPPINQFPIPIIWSKFTTQFDNNPFLGRNSQDPARSQYDFKKIYPHALAICKENDDLSPSQEAIQRTQKAAVKFYQRAYQFCQENDISFPLKDLNKCIGFVAVPNTKLVLIALSQDRDPQKDEPVRKDLMKVISGINQQSENKRFELVATPTKEQYLMVRALHAKSPWQNLKDEEVKARTRCVEVALAVACNKIGRTRKLEAKDLSILSFGSGMWATPDTHDADMIPGFQASERNQKYLFQDSLEVQLEDRIGWLDPWKPCPEHCGPFLHSIRALSVSGGASTSYFEPRSEPEPLQKNGFKGP